MTQIPNPSSDPQQADLPPGEQANLDPAAKSLGDALTLSFKLLTFIMLVLLGVFFFTGFYWVDEKEVAVQTRFGKIVQASDGLDYRTAGGPYLGLPAPIDKITKVPTTQQRIELRREFWFDVPEADQGKTADQLMSTNQRNLSPGRDNSLITGDKNVMHARFSVSYVIQARDASLFVKNVGDIPRANRLVELVAQEAVVKAVSTSRADDLFRGLFEDGRARARANIQQKLLEMNSGITVNEVIMTAVDPPMSVRQAFLDVVTAQSEREQRIEQANQEAERLQSEAAGPVYGAMVVLVDEFERARRPNLGTNTVSPKEQLLGQAINDLLDGKNFGQASKAWLASETDQTIKARLSKVSPDAAISGEASRVIAEARTFKTQTVQLVKADVELFEKILPFYKENPQLAMQRRWLETYQQMLSGDVEKFVVTPGQEKDLIVPFRRDPAIARARQEAAARAQQLGEAPPPPSSSGTTPARR
jgi:modulator of FtsH protease HflK